MTLNDSPEPATTRTRVTARTIWIAIGVVVVIVAAIIGGNAYIASRDTGIAETPAPTVQQNWPDAETVAEEYLEALIDRDSTTAADLRASTFELQPGGIADEVLVGNAEVAEQIGLNVDAEILGMVESSPDDFGNYNGLIDADRVDRATVTYRVSYSLVAEGKPVKASNIQALQLSRETLNAAGETVEYPGPVADGQFTFGPWLVDTFEFRAATGGLTEPAQAVSNYKPEGFDTKAVCIYPWLDFVVRSGIRTESGDVDPECYAGNGSLLSGEQESIDYLFANLAKLEDEQLVSLLGPVYGNISADNPLTQLQFPVGDRTFIVTYLAVDPAVSTTSREDTRIIAVTEVP